METSRQKKSDCLICQGRLGLWMRTVVHKNDGRKGRVCAGKCYAKAKKIGYE